MTPREANVLLTKAALVDPFIVPDVERAERWAELLPDVALTDALLALAAHERETRESVRPADIAARVAELRREREMDRQDALLALEAPAVDRAERRAFLAELMPDVFGEEQP